MNRGRWAHGYRAADVVYCRQEPADCQCSVQIFWGVWGLRVQASGFSASVVVVLAKDGHMVSITGYRFTLVSRYSGVLPHP